MQISPEYVENIIVAFLLVPVPPLNASCVSRVSKNPRWKAKVFNTNAEIFLDIKPISKIKSLEFQTVSSWRFHQGIELGVEEDRRRVCILAERWRGKELLYGERPRNASMATFGWGRWPCTTTPSARKSDQSLYWGRKAWKRSDMFLSRHRLRVCKEWTEQALTGCAGTWPAGL